MKNDLPPLFSVRMPDDSMSPWVMRGDLVRFSRSRQPRAGEIILCADGDGGWYARIYKPGRIGQWKAAPLNNDFDPLESERDGLELLGYSMGWIERQSHKRPSLSGV